MIARNEERGIIAALDSVRGLVNEVVVAIDPTSTDRTWDNVEAWLKEWDPSGENWILMQGKSVEEVGFADARNVTLEVVRSEWVLILDSDERVPDGETFMVPGADGKWGPRNIASQQIVRMTLQQINPEIELLAVTMVMCDEQDRVLSQFQGERLIRKHLRFRRPMHNYVAGVKVSAISDISIIHNRKHRSPVEREYRAKQRLRLAEKFFPKLIEEDPKDTRSLFYLAGAYAESDKPDEAIEWYRKYLAQDSEFPQERYQAAVFLGRCLLQKAERAPTTAARDKLYDEVRRISAAAIADNYDRAECHYQLGQVAHAQEDYKQALFFYETAAKCEFRVDPHFVEAATHTWAPRIGIAACHYALGNSEEAVRAVEEARERGAPDGAIAHLMNFIAPRYNPPRQLGLFINKGDSKFILPLLEKWSAHYKVCVSDRLETLEETLNWCDTAFFEFGGELLIRATQLPHRCRMIVRIHGHEIHAGFLPQVNWKRVDTVIFVADYLRDIAFEQCPEMKEHCQSLVIPGGISWKRYSIGANKQGNKIAVSGYLNHKKQIGKAVEILYEAKKTRPELELHICGTIQESRPWLYLGTLIEELGLRAVECRDGMPPSEADIYFYPWQDDLNPWFADKDYILSTSMEESFHYAVAQGMAAGLKPIIHCWRSSRDFYKPEWIYRTLDEAVAMLADVPTTEEREGYREYVKERLSFDAQERAIDLVLARRTVSVPAPDGAPSRFEVLVAQALEGMGFAPAAPVDADILFCLEGTPEVLDLPRSNGQTRIYWNAAQIVGGDERAKHRRKIARRVARRNETIVVAGTPLGAEKMGTRHAIYQGGASRNWRPTEVVEKSIDVGFYGIPNARRKGIIKRLGSALREQGGMRVEALTSHDVPEVRRFVQACRIMLNIHWTKHPNTEARVAEVLSTGTFLLTEKLAEGHPFPEGLFVEWETPEDLLEKATYYLSHAEEREAIAQRGRDWVWENLRVEQQVSRVLELAGARWAPQREMVAAEARG